MSQNKYEKQLDELRAVQIELEGQRHSLFSRYGALITREQVKNPNAQYFSPKAQKMGLLIQKLQVFDEKLFTLVDEYRKHNKIYPNITVNFNAQGIMMTENGEPLPGTDEMSEDERYQKFQKVLGDIITESNLWNEDMKQHRGEKWYVPIQECLRKLFNICQTTTEKILTNVAKHGIFEPKAGNLDPTEDAQHRHVPGK